MLEPQDRGHERASAAGTDIPDLPYVRLTQRGRPPRERRSLWTLLALVLAGHVLLGWVAYAILRPSPYHPNESGVFSVTLIEPGPGLPPPPPLLAPPPLPGQPAPATPSRRLHYVPPSPDAISATLKGVNGPPLDLYDSNGKIRLAPNTQPQPAPAYSAPGLQGSQIYSGKPPIEYKPTRFNKDWAPLNESLGAKTVGRAFDKAVEKTTIKKTIRLPGGGKIHCAIAPLLLMAMGCQGDPPAPPPKNDDDIRLSMPPAQTLTGKKVPLPSSASSAPPASASSVSPPSASSALPRARASSGT